MPELQPSLVSIFVPIFPTLLAASRDAGVSNFRLIQLTRTLSEKRGFYGLSKAEGGQVAKSPYFPASARTFGKIADCVVDRRRSGSGCRPVAADLKTGLAPSWWTPGLSCQPLIVTPFKFCGTAIAER